MFLYHGPDDRIKHDNMLRSRVLHVAVPVGRQTTTVSPGTKSVIYDFLDVHVLSVARSSSGGVAIRYILPVLSMPSDFHIGLGLIAQW